VTGNIGGSPRGGRRIQPRSIRPAADPETAGAPQALPASVDEDFPDRCHHPVLMGDGSGHQDGRTVCGWAHGLGLAGHDPRRAGGHLARPTVDRLTRSGRSGASLRKVLDGCPMADDAVLLTSELAANAVMHSDSKQPDAEFVLRAEIFEGKYLRVEVEDQGGPLGPRVWPGQRPLAWAGSGGRDG